MASNVLDQTRRSPGGLLRLGGVCLVGLAVLYRPIEGGLGYGLLETVLAGLLLAAALAFWACGSALDGQPGIRLGGPGAVATLFGLFFASALLSCLAAGNWFGGLRWWLLIGTCGLTGFLLYQTGAREPVRRFYLACFLATAVALAAHAIWQHVLYLSALREARTAPADGGAYGVFGTPGALAGFLVLGALPLAGLIWGLARRARMRALLAGACLAAVGAALALTRSVGGAAAASVGVAVLLAAFARRPVPPPAEAGRPSRAALRWPVVLLAVALLGAGVALAAVSARWGGRGEAWRAAVRMSVRRPLLGVGPGSWPEWYAIVREPGSGDAPSAQGALVQLWAETGAIGVALFLAFWCVLLGRVMGRRASAGDAPPDAGRQAAARSPALLIAGPVLAAGALAFDSLVSGTLLPPGGAAGSGAALLPYALVFLVWTCAFLAVYGGPPADPGPVAWGLGAGAAAFLVHCGVESALEVPALGAGAAALAGLALLYARPRPAPAPRASRAAAWGVAAGAVAALLVWGAVASRAVRHSTLQSAAFRARLEMLGSEGEEQMRARGGDLLARYSAVVDALPWDDGAWRDLGVCLVRLHQAQLAEDALPAAIGALSRAAELNPFSSDNRVLLGWAYATAGDWEQAARAYRRGAELSPSQPAPWYLLARSADEVPGLRGGPEVREALRHTAELLPLERDPLARILGSPFEVVEAWAQANGKLPEAVCAEMWRDHWNYVVEWYLWEELSAKRRVEFAVEQASRAMPGYLVPDDVAAFLWRAAAPKAHWGLLARVGAAMADRAAGRKVTFAWTPEDALDLLLADVPDGQALRGRWRSLDDSAREEALWEAAGARLWQWAVEEKLAQAEAEAEQVGGE